jgi:heat shock protein HtpX
MMHSARNTAKTALLLGLLSALILLAGQALGGTGGLLAAGVLAIAVNGAAYFFSDSLALRGVLAHGISHGGNRDTLIATVAAGLASMLMILV